MITRRHILPSLGLLLISCDKPKENSAVTENESSPSRITKSVRPPQNDEPVVTPAQLRETMKQAAEITSPKERDQALQEIIWDALELDPDLAREGFKQLTSGSPERNQFIQHFALRLAEASLEQAAEWAATLQNDQEKSLAYDNIALVLAESEPEKAAQILSDSGVAGRNFDVAVVQVVQRWAANSPADAAAWVSLFDDGEARRAGLKTVVATWSRTDPQATMAWLASLQNPSIHQEASTGMAETILELPESRQDALLRLVSPEIRASFEKLKAEAKRP
jgi:hypothetical protein